MAIETEVKIELDRKAKVDEIYQAIERPNWEIQRNYIFSFGNNLLRLRQENDKAYLTAKGVNNGTEFNSREEVECVIPVEFFMGFASLVSSKRPPLYYEKSRASARFMDCQVCLDNFFGIRYLEIEGREENIRRVISRFELEDFPIEKRSYLELLMSRND